MLSNHAIDLLFSKTLNLKSLLASQMLTLLHERQL